MGEEKLVDPGVIEELGRDEGGRASETEVTTLGGKRCHGSELVCTRVGVTSHRHSVQLWKIPFIHLEPLLPSPCLSHPQ